MIPDGEFPHLAPRRGQLGAGSDAKRNHQVLVDRPGADQYRLGRAKTKIDVIPRHRSISSFSSRRTWNHARVGVPLHNLASGLQRDVVQGVRKLAKPSPDGRNQAALLQHAALDVSATLAGPPDMPPETENTPR